ncbi:hypothetical protein [Streptomyces globisporus]|uniref:hypothetical protein n=1 Tax=Streptomyces globisporus TaxID=1908 RepID=UPI003460F8AE
MRWARPACVPLEFRSHPASVLPHALVVPADPEDDGVVGEQHEDQEHGAEPARPPLSVARAREMTAGLREAMDDVRRSVAVLAARVQPAHVARVWASLGYGSSEVDNPRRWRRHTPAGRCSRWW